jgi:hypothetical protein
MRGLLLSGGSAGRRAAPLGTGPPRRLGLGRGLPLPVGTGPLLKWRCSQRRRVHSRRQCRPATVRARPGATIIHGDYPGAWQPPCRAARRDSGLTFRFLFKGPVVLHLDSCRAGARRSTVHTMLMCLACEGAFVILGSQPESRNLGSKSRNLGRVGSTGDARAQPRSITH